MLASARMTTIAHEWITLEPEDGTSLQCFVARAADEHNRHAGVIVFQEIWGVNDHIRSVTDRIARLGYTALAPDIFHRTSERFEAPYTDRSGLEHLQKLTPEGVRADIVAAHAWLSELLLESTDEPRIAACGFCMGGRLAITANAMLPLACAISFYGGGLSNNLDLAAQQHGPALLFWAGQDTHIPKEGRRAFSDSLDAAQKRFTEVTVSHAQHGYFCDQRPTYDAEAARESWGLVVEYLNTNLAE